MYLLISKYWYLLVLWSQTFNPIIILNSDYMYFIYLYFVYLHFNFEYPIRHHTYFHDHKCHIRFSVSHWLFWSCLCPTLNTGCWSCDNKAAWNFPQQTSLWCSAFSWSHKSNIIQHPQLLRPLQILESSIWSVSPVEKKMLSKTIPDVSYSE